MHQLEGQDHGQDERCDSKGAALATGRLVHLGLRGDLLAELGGKLGLVCQLLLFPGVCALG